MICEELLEKLKCAVSDEEHFIIKPISLACGHLVSKTCIRNMRELKCKICYLTSYQE